MANQKIEFEIAAKLDNIDRSFAQVGKMAQDAARKVDAAFSGLNLSGLFAGIGAGAFVAMTRDVANAGDALAKMSTRTGIAVEELSKLQYAASLSDVSNEDLAGSLGRLNKVLGEAANGSKEATEALARFGIAPGTLNVSQAFAVIADRVKNTSDQTQIASAMNGIFSKSWATLVPMIKSGSDGLKQAGDELERMNGVMSGDLARSSEEFNDNITRLNTQLNALKLQTLGPLIPLLQELTGAMAASSDKTNDLAKSGGLLKTAFEAIGGLGANVAYVFKQTGNEIGGMAAQLALLARGDFKGASSIGAMMKEDAKQARVEVDALTYRILNAQDMIAARQIKDSWLPQTPSASSGTGIVGTPPDVKKPKKQKQDDALGDFLKDIEDRIKPAEQALDSFRQMQLDAAVAGSDLTRSEKKFYDLINSPEWLTMGDPWKELVRQQFEAANAAEKAATEEAKLIALLAATPTAKQQELVDVTILLDKAFKAGRISAEQLTEAVQAAVGNVPESVEKATDAIEEFSKQAARNMQDALADFLFEPFDQGVDGMLKSFGTMIQKMVAQAVAADLAKRMFGSLGGGSGDGWLGAGLKWVSGLFANADGGVYASPGLSAYSGQVVSRPTLFPFAAGMGLMGEAGPEAILPLKRGSDGKLGVASGGGGHTINVYVQGQSAPDVRRAAGQGAREAMTALNAAQRYR